MREDVPILQARGLHKAYGRTEALRGASMTAGTGEVVAVTGPSGSGSPRSCCAWPGSSDRTPARSRTPGRGWTT